MKITFDVNDKHISIDLVALDLVFGGDTSVYSLSFLKDVEFAFFNSVEYYKSRGLLALANHHLKIARSLHDALDDTLSDHDDT